jgi:two-component system OmpR family response regulator
LRQLREDGHATPVVIITARDNVEDRILGLDVGADDYVLKPFDAKELLARMRAVLRRLYLAMAL